MKVSIHPACYHIPDCYVFADDTAPSRSLAFLSVPLELRGSIISRHLSFRCSRCFSPIRCLSSSLAASFPLPFRLVSSWLPGNTREHELLIKFHSFLACRSLLSLSLSLSLFFLGFLNRALIALESRWLLPSPATCYRTSALLVLLAPPSACSLNWRIIM